MSFQISHTRGITKKQYERFLSNFDFIVTESKKFFSRETRKVSFKKRELSARKHHVNDILSMLS